MASCLGLRQILTHPDKVRNTSPEFITHITSEPMETAFQLPRSHASEETLSEVALASDYPTGKTLGNSALQIHAWQRIICIIEIPS